MKISVITVCYNEENNIERTVKSVLRQSNKNYEYIICDGKSTDKTLEIAESYRSDFNKNGIDFKVISKKDGGVYFGMNNGIDVATGNYIIFMNAGDTFYGTEAISAVLKALEEADSLPDVIYGDSNDVRRGFYMYLKADHNKLTQGMSMCHQSIFVSSDVMKQEKFDTSLKICADYNLFLGLFLNGKRFLHIDAVISNFYEGGISTVRIDEALEETFKIKDRYGIKYDEKAERKSAKDMIKKIKILDNMPYFMRVLWYRIKNRKNMKDLNNN